MRKKMTGLVMIILVLMFSGCGDMTTYSQPTGETVYEVSNVVVVEDYHNSIKEYNFSYICTDIENIESEYIDTYIPEQELEKQKMHEMKNYKDEMNGQRQVRSARSSKYGYRNCYVVDQEKNECLYLTDEYL